MTEPLGNDSTQVKVTLAIGKPASIREIAEDAGLDPAFILSECQKLIDFHWRFYGTRAVTIEYSSQLGYQLVANSGVGAIGSESLLIKVEPKVPGVKIEKILAMSQFAGDALWNIGNANIAAQVDQSEDYDLVEILGFILCDYTQTIIANGLLKSYSEEVSSHFRASGGPDLLESISSGFTPPPKVIEVVDNFDIAPNRIVKTALQRVVRVASDEILKSNAYNLLTAFESVALLAPGTKIEQISSALFSIPRRDYDRAMAVSYAILNNQSATISIDSEIELPSVILDMDKVFEKFCSKVLNDTLDSKFFDVSLQREFRHKATPELSSKKIIPDIVITERKTGVPIVLDAKNKYSVLSAGGHPSISNADIYQQFYYQQNLDASLVILLFPSSKPKWSFPLPATESGESYRSKCDASVRSITFPLHKFEHKGSAMRLIPMQIDLSGSLKNSINSVKRVALFLQYFYQNRQDFS